MIKRIRLSLRLLAIVMLLATVAYTGQAQVVGEASPMVYPAAMQSGDVKMAIEMTMIKMPEAVVEEADTYRWPAWTLDTWFGLPENFVANARVTTQFINWHFQAGPKWQWGGLHPVRMYVGADYAYFIGGIGAGAFDNTNHSSFFYPNVSIGWSSSSIAVTVKGELNYCLSKIDRAGDIETSVSKNFFNGGTVGLYLEQNFWGTTNFEIGFRASSLKYVYQNWLLFPTVDKSYFVPEFMFGVRI